MTINSAKGRKTVLIKFDSITPFTQTTISSLLKYTLEAWQAEGESIPELNTLQIT